MTDATTNPYLSPAMPLERVRADALHGVRLAREAWRARDPDGAARELGYVTSMGGTHENPRNTTRLRHSDD